MIAGRGSEIVFQDKAKFLHMVDLDGAKKKKYTLFKTIGQILENTDLKIQTGGGIRDYESVKRLINMGVDKVVVGSVARK